MNHKERMLAGLPYLANEDGLDVERAVAQDKVHLYNQLLPSAKHERQELLKKIIGKMGENATIEQPFRCDYGKNIFVGDHFFANYNAVFLDCGKITIGNHVMFGPNVSLYAAGHPIHPTSRNSGYEYGLPITIGDNVWLGGSVVVNPGVTIGNNVVVASGSVVTKDLPDNVVAAGVPCKVIREITEEDRPYYYGKELFDVEDY